MILISVLIKHILNQLNEFKSGFSTYIKAREHTQSSFISFKIFHGLILCLILITPSPIALSSELNPATVTIKSYDPYENLFLLEISIQEGWDLYGPYQGDDGVPLTITHSESHNVKQIDMKWPKPIYIKLVNSSNNIYRGNISAALKVMPLDKSSVFSSRITVQMSACKDICKKFEQSIYISNIDSTQYEQYILMMFFAFIGGFILNFMPCVLPVILLKIHSVVHHNNASENDRRNFCIAISLGIISVFLAIACIGIFAKSIGEYAGWGFHFQNTKFITVVCILTFLSALIMNDDLNIVLPPFLRKGNNDYISSFSSGALATLLSTPCTAPFITPAVAFALSHEWYIILLIHIFMGIGMSIPFVILFITPRALSFIPKSGIWMLYFKKASAIAMMCVVIWLLYIIYNQLGAKPAIFITGCFLLLKFVLLKYTRKTAIILSIALIFSILYIPEFIRIEDIENEKEVDLYWEPFSESKLKQYRSNGDIVFLDITADWCVICKANKFFVLDDIELLEFLKSENVKLIRGDLTSHSEEIMNFMKKNNRNGIPYNLMYGNKSPHIITFSEILTIFDIKKAVKTLKNSKL